MSELPINPNTNYQSMLDRAVYVIGWAGSLTSALFFGTADRLGNILKDHNPTELPPAQTDTEPFTNSLS